MVWEKPTNAIFSKTSDKNSSFFKLFIYIGYVVKLLKSPDSSNDEAYFCLVNIVGVAKINVEAVSSESVTLSTAKIVSQI